jgi:hypothetical protein
VKGVIAVTQSEAVREVQFVSHRGSWFADASKNLVWISKAVVEFLRGARSGPVLCADINVVSNLIGRMNAPVLVCGVRLYELSTGYFLAEVLMELSHL